MAVKIATADGNWTTGATWATADATAQLDSEANNTVLTTSYVESSTFAPGAITIDGIAVKVNNRAVSPTGTISIRLATGGVLVAGTEVTINVSDIDARNLQQGWYFFKFAAPVLLLAATNYTVSAKTSNANMVNLYRNSTAGNWSRMLRTTTTGAPGAGDSAHILGEWTAAATKTDRTVTMDETASTDYGDNSKTNPPGITIGKGGTLTWGTTAATNYVLKLSTSLAIYKGGTMTMGTTGTPMPRDSTAQLQFDCDTADGDFGCFSYGTDIRQGLSRTSGKNVVACRLNTDEAIGQTTLGLDTDTGWKGTDEVAIAGTTRTASEAEIRILNADAGASSIVITVALSNAHSGTSPTAAHVILLTRNVLQRSLSTTLMAFHYVGVDATIDWDWAGWRYHGATTSPKRGIEIDTGSTGSFNMNFCSAFQFDNWGIFFSSATGDNYSVTNCTGYSIGVNGSTSGGITTSASTGVNFTISDNVIIGDNTNGPSYFLQNAKGTFARNVGANSSKGVHIDDILARCVMDTGEYYGNQGPNFDIVAVATFKHAGTLKLWRANATGGLQIAECHDLEIAACEAFGNATSNIVWTTSISALGRQLFRNLNLNGDSTFSTANGLDFQNSGKTMPLVIVENSDLGVATGIKVTHTSVDVQFGTSRRFVDIRFRDTRLASATEFGNSASLIGRSRISRQRIDGTTNSHNTIYPALGTITYDAAVFRTAAPSERLTPSGATSAFRLQSSIRRVSVEAAATPTVNAYVRKDGSYTGSAARLIVLANPSMGLDVDTVLDTHSAAAGTWEQLTGVLPAATEAGVWQVIVDVDGSAGNVYTDDWSAS